MSSSLLLSPPKKKGYSCVWIIYNLLSGPSSESGSWIFIANSRHSSDLSSSPSLTHIFLPLAEAFVIRNNEWVKAYFTSTRRAASSCVIEPDIAVVRNKKGLNICEVCSRARVSVWISDWKRRRFRRRKSAWERTFFMHNMMSGKKLSFSDWLKKLSAARLNGQRWNAAVACSVDEDKPFGSYINFRLKFNFRLHTFSRCRTRNEVKIWTHSTVLASVQHRFQFDFISTLLSTTQTPPSSALVSCKQHFSHSSITSARRRSPIR